LNTQNSFTTFGTAGPWENRDLVEWGPLQSTQPVYIPPGADSYFSYLGF